MLASLEEAYKFVSTTPRRRLRNQPHWRLNQAYFDLIFAWGFARSGHPERSAELQHAATRVLPSTDPVHQTLLKAFTLRIAEKSASPWTPLAIDLSALEDFARYKVCRLLQYLAILSRVEFWDPMTDFWRSAQTNQKPAQVTDAVTSILLADGEGRTADVFNGIRALALDNSN